MPICYYLYKKGEGGCRLNPIPLQDIPEPITDHVGTVKSIAFPRQGHTSDVAIIVGTAGRYVIKRAKGEQYSGWLFQEADVLRALRAVSLPVPDIYQLVKQPDDSQAWALLQFLEGETLREALQKERRSAKRQELIYKFGACLSAVHATPCPESLVGNSDWLDNRLKQAEYNLAHYEMDGTAELLQWLKTNKPLPQHYTFIHGDFTIDNVLVAEGNISGIIDWSGGAFGDPRYDLSLAIRPKPNAFENRMDIDAFFAGYGTQTLTEQEYIYFTNGLYAFF
ncbi:aminoglycoside phosphotransferase family protein [Paenibacillus solanacearum]|uniref:phosphotransferase family protein n=1 Tax=Paenibacillus solanacearum TaxID=2048548 RepID=UPI0031B9F436